MRTELHHRSFIRVNGRRIAKVLVRDCSRRFAPDHPGTSERIRTDDTVRRLCGGRGEKLCITRGYALVAARTRTSVQGDLGGLPPNNREIAFEYFYRRRESEYNSQAAAEAAPSAV